MPIAHSDSVGSAAIAAAAAKHQAQQQLAVAVKTQIQQQQSQSQPLQKTVSSSSSKKTERETMIKTNLKSVYEQVNELLKENAFYANEVKSLRQKLELKEMQLANANASLETKTAENKNLL